MCAMRTGRGLASVYLWLKAVHVIAVIAWMAGIFYLPRLFVYHVEAGVRGDVAAVFKIMERRLYRIIMAPAMGLAWLSGGLLVWLLWDSGITTTSVWAWVKLAAVVMMSLLHLRLGWHLRQFDGDRNRYSSRYFRWLNEAPTLLMIVIVVMVVTKPF
jgi:protoporphyrinogen IX oxidase